MKSKPSFSLPRWLFLLTFSAAATHAQPVTAIGATAVPGLLGQTYNGVEVAYINHTEDGPPDSLRRYSFVSSRPLIEKNNVDAAFRYDFIRGSAFGQRLQQHDVAMSFTGYVPATGTSLFARGDIGWTWSRSGGSWDNSFAYLLGVGAEIPLSPRLVLIPSINFRDIRQAAHDDWQYGAKLSWTLRSLWTATAGVHADDHRNLEFSFGVQRRY